MRKLFLPLLLVPTLLVAMGCASVAVPEAEVVTQEVEVTRIVEGTPVVQTEAIFVTATPALMPEQPKVMVVCTGGEPSTLIWSDSSLVTTHVLEAVQEPLYDTRGYGYQANLVEKLPSFEDGDATVEEVTVGEGDLIYDISTDTVLTLTAAMTETFSLAQLEGEPAVVEGYNGEELTTVQTTARWTLVEGLTWEDGEPVTADDSVYASEVARDPEYTGKNKYLVDRTASYTALDERTIEWKGLPGYLDSTYFINVWNPQPRHRYGEMTVHDLYESEVVNRDPLGYGPYVVDEWVAGESITLSPNPHYVRGEPPLDRLIYRFVRDANQLVAQLAAGECDLGTQDATLESALPLIRSLAKQGLLELQEVAGTSFEHLDFNLQPVEGYTGAAATLTDNEGNLLFQNADFRRAVAQCIDRQAIVDAVLSGAGFVQHGYVTRDHPLYPGDDAISIWEFNPEAGRELLARLGWEDADGDGILDKDGQPLTFVHSSLQNKLREAVAQIVQAQLRENCGIQTEIELIAPALYFALGPDGPISGRRYDLGEFSWYTSVEPPCDLYITSTIPNEVNGWSGQNFIGYSNPEFDNACNAALQALDPEEKAAQHARALAIFTDDLPSIPLFARSKLSVHAPYVEGVQIDPTANSEFWNVENFDLNLD